MSKEILKKHIKSYPNFPKEGIVFKDIMPLFANSDLLTQTLALCAMHVKKISQCDAVVGIESRGFLLGCPVALLLEKSFIAARKKGKLPGDVLTETYSLEYGEDSIQIQRERIEKNKHYIIVDDLLATGGTALATARLIKTHGGIVAGFFFLIEHQELNGKNNLQTQFPDAQCEVILSY